MMRLLANLADLTRLEAGRLQLQRLRLRPAELLETVIAQRRLLASARKIAIEAVCDEQVDAPMDGDLVLRVLENLFDNALRHVPPGGRIEARCEVYGNDVHIRIGNSGPPIPLEARQLIFEKFAQPSAASGRMNLGLGLYFCRLAIEAHGGRIHVDESRDLPAIFTLELPRGDRVIAA